MTVGSGVTVKPSGYSDNWGNDDIYVVQESSGTYLAYSLSCTHQGCVVSKSGSGWRCGCHGATFSATGAHTGGPGNGDLQSYQVCADSTGVTLTLQ
jgi:Rieske Fe-S protein